MMSAFDVCVECSFIPGYLGQRSQARPPDKDQQEIEPIDDPYLRLHCRERGKADRIER